MLGWIGIGHFTRHDSRLLDDMQNLSSAVIHPDGKDLASAVFCIMFDHLKCQVITRCTNTPTIVVIVISTTAFFPAATVIATACCADDAAIRLIGTGWGGLRQDR
jgi:hypothetical protein